MLYKGIKMGRLFKNLLILVLVLPISIFASKVYITTGSFDKNNKPKGEEFCKKVSERKLNRIFKKYKCQNTNILNKKNRKMEWYQCENEGKKDDLLVTYTSTSFDCETRTRYALSKQRENKGKVTQIKTVPKYYMSVGSLYESEAKSFCVEVKKDDIGKLTYRNGDCSDYSSKLRKFTGAIDYYKCDNYPNIYITRDGVRGDTTKVGSVEACKKLNEKVAHQSDPNSLKEFITFGRLDMNSHKNLQTYCMPNQSDDTALNLLKTKLGMNCTDTKMSDSINFSTKNLKKYFCSSSQGDTIIHITRAKDKYSCQNFNKNMDKKIKALEKEASDLAIANQLSKQRAHKLAKEKAEKLKLAQDNGFNSYAEYEAFKIKEKRDARAEYERKAKLEREAQRKANRERRAAMQKADAENLKRMVSGNNFTAVIDTHYHSGCIYIAKIRVNNQLVSCTTNSDRSRTLIPLDKGFNLEVHMNPNISSRGTVPKTDLRILNRAGTEVYSDTTTNGFKTFVVR